jgi:toxin-antitoxin system PIN domain toxin
MAISIERAFVDTNILVYALLDDSPHHAAACALLNSGQAGDRDLFVSSQVLAEFFAVITNPKRVTLVMPPEDAIDAVRQIATLPGISVLPPPADLLERWLALSNRRLVKQAEVFDLSLVATMLAHDVRILYTYNLTHFQWCADIEVRAP